MRHAIALLALALTVACDRRDRFAAPDTMGAPRVPERSVYLSVSDLAPDAGGTIVVAASVAVAGDLTVGSYRVRLAFDSSRMHFVEEIQTPGTMRAVNPRAEEVVVVGAASGGADGRLFTLRFRVDDPAGLGSLALRIDELNDAAFADRKSAVTQASRLVEDRSLVPGRIAPRSIGSTTRPATATAEAPSIDSISPRSAELENERVTDVVLYGRGFAPTGNLVLFGDAEVRGLMSERGGTIIRFVAPVRRVEGGRLSVRVRHDGGTSNAVIFTAAEDDR